MRLALPAAVPEIPVKNIGDAAAFYERHSGFTLDWGSEELGLAGISIGNCRMFLADSADRKQYGTVGPVLTWLNVESKEGRFAPVIFVRRGRGGYGHLHLAATGDPMRGLRLTRRNTVGAPNGQNGRVLSMARAAV